jgi:ketosteroid isomerase-like protein
MAARTGKTRRNFLTSGAVALAGLGLAPSAFSEPQVKLKNPNKEKGGLDAIIEQTHLALGEFVKGNPEPMKLVWSSHRDEVTLGNPFGPFAHGWTQVVTTMERAASLYKDGVALGFETISKYETPNLAYTVGIERYKASIGGKDAAEVALRCTSIFRRENGTWKLVHRHADPITTVRAAESVVPK